MGINIIELPQHSHDLKLNNKGQIAGNYRDGPESPMHGFIWDPITGFCHISSLGQGDIFVYAINDLGQIIGEALVFDDEEDELFLNPFLWDHGKTINLTEEFYRQISGDWFHLQTTSINNLGQIIITAKRKVAKHKQITKSFLLKDGNFSLIIPEKNHELTVDVKALDDNGNMIAEIEDKTGFSKKVFLKCY